MRIIINNSKDSNKHKKIFRKYFFEVFNRVYTSPNIAIIRRFEEEAKEKNIDYTILKISKKIPGGIEIEKKVIKNNTVFNIHEGTEKRQNFNFKKF